MRVSPPLAARHITAFANPTKDGYTLDWLLLQRDLEKAQMSPPMGSAKGELYFRIRRVVMSSCANESRRHWSLSYALGADEYLGKGDPTAPHVGRV
ncbi:hypothetical protein GN958_ATG00626 [Phytophthora infestans]|uniref:Uncharacterized protein n=1 Tax=Phytophthora infestans TaxID=4787 RepID=A0A8S9VB40_PHYIN|nr:hypothetical protein GN958_ATG00626 [Phytophthora infestans]